MRLTVIAADLPVDTRSTNSWVLRLVGTAQFEEAPPPNILKTVDEAAARVRATFPKWLWQWISSNGALDLAVFDPSISWWWYTPLSEKSPLRSGLIREIYWLTLLRIVCETGGIDEVDWFGDDPVIASAASRVAAQSNLKFRARISNARSKRMGAAIIRRMLYSGYAIFRWIIVKAFFAGMSTHATDANVALYTRFPILWERETPIWRERMFGTWPAYLETHGHRPIYAAALSASPVAVMREWRSLRQRCAEQKIVILENSVSFLALLSSHFNLGLLWRYLRWRKRVKQSVLYDGSDVTELFWREMDECVVSSEIPFDLTLAAGFRSMAKRCPALAAVFLPFEYQPMERAVWAGTKSVRNIPLVGLQTGLFEANQMGFCFPPEEAKQGVARDLKSPVPDFLAAYGELPYKVFAERLGRERVCLSGPVRYPYLQSNGPRGAAAEHISGAPEASVFVLVASSISPEESLPLLEGAFRVGVDLPDLFFLFKFHYHLPLHSEVERLADQYRMKGRFQIFEGELHKLMQLSSITLCAGTSIGIEALAFDSMPVVFRSLGEMSSNPMLEVPDAVFFWNSISELRAALQSCLDRNDEYERRRSAWPQAIADQLFDLSGSADARLYQFLSERSIL